MTETEPKVGRRERAREVLASLCSTFPGVFSRNDPKPLKVRIDLDIVARLGDLDRRTLSTAMRKYCNQPRYLVACVEGATRVDLDGHAAGTVTATEAARSKKIVDDLSAKRLEEHEHEEKANVIEKARPQRDEAQQHQQHEAQRQRTAFRVERRVITTKSRRRTLRRREGP